MNDQRLEEIIGRLLQAGVLLSASIVALGGIWLLITCGGERPHYDKFQPPAEFLRSPGRLIASLRHPDPAAVIQFGLLLLIATPVARVVLALIGFGLEHDYRYVAITLIVLVVLLYSLVLA